MAAARRALQSRVPDPTDNSDFASGLNLSALIAQLGTSDQKDQARNRILALGQRIIPELVDELVYHRFHIDATPPTLLSELEGLIADFGPCAVEPITQRLSRWSTSHRCAPAMLRIIESLGDEHFHQLMGSHQSITQGSQREMRFLSHLLLRRSDARTCNLLLLPILSDPQMNSSLR